MTEAMHSPSLVSVAAGGLLVGSLSAYSCFGCCLGALRCSGGVWDRRQKPGDRAAARRSGQPRSRQTHTVTAMPGANSSLGGRGGRVRSDQRPLAALAWRCVLRRAGVSWALVFRCRVHSLPAVAWVRSLAQQQTRAHSAKLSRSGREGGAIASRQRAAATTADVPMF